MPMYNSEKSRIRMYVLRPHGEKNQPFYSPIQDNRKPDEIIIKLMLGRLLSQIGNYNVIEFYENKPGGLLLHTVKK